MIRLALVAALTCLGAGGLLAQAPADRPPAPPSPDPAYRHREGDRAVILMDNVPAATSRAILDDYVAARDRGDRVGMEREVKAGNILTLGRGEAVSIVRVHSFPRVAPSGGIGLSIPEYQRAMAAARAREGSHPAGYPVEVRVAGGPSAERLLVVEKEYVGQLLSPAAQPAPQPAFPTNPPRKKARPVPKSLPPRPVDPVTRSAASLQLGKNLRFDGKRDAAIEYLRRAVAQAPDSPSAVEARKILKDMGVE